MTTEDDEQPLADVNKPSKSVIEEDKLGIEVIRSEGQCESSPLLVVTNLNVGGEIAETVPLEDNPVSPASGEGTVLRKSEARVEVIEKRAEADEGSGEMIYGKYEDQPLENGAEEETKVVLGTVVTDTDDTLMEEQLEIAAEGESAPVVVTQLEDVVTEVSDAPQPETEMDTRADKLVKKKEATKEGNSETDMVMDVKEKIEEVSEDNNEFLGCQTNESEMVVKGDESELVVKGNEEDLNKVEGNVYYADTGLVDNSAAINGESMIFEEISSSEFKLEVDGSAKFKADVVYNSEPDNLRKLSNETRDDSAEMSDPAETKGVAAELISETKEEDGDEVSNDTNVDEPMSVAEDKKVVVDEELSNNTNVDKPMSVAEDKKVVVAEEEHLEGDVDMEMDAGAGEELANNIQLADAEPETETGDDAGADKILEGSKMKTDGQKELDLGREMDESPDALLDEEDDTMSAEDEARTQDPEMETETDVNGSGKSSGGKRKRGKLSNSPPSSKPAAKSSSRTVGEDVCFICFDGGDLFLCDRRGCPKAYHPSCVNRDEAFFRAKGRWNCGWHMCSICEKNPRYMCYTCTFSLCRSCTKDAAIMIVRENKGFCETCLRTVTLIENNEQGNKEDQIDFDDKSSWEYLFKDYYLELKATLSLSSIEIAEAKNPWKGTNSTAPRKQESSEALPDPNDEGSDIGDSTEKSETIRPKRRKLRKQSKSLTKREGLRRRDIAAKDKAGSTSDKTEWASNELLEFVSHMKDGDTSILSQFEVQALLLEYIKRNKLRDPRRKSHIICDARFGSLFGKPRVGHFEMLKLLESHFLSIDEQNDDVEGSVVDTDNKQLDNDDDSDLLTKSRRRKSRRRSDLVAQSNLDDYAAIDMHNISLIYLKRKLMEDLLEEPENFHDRAVGTFVRIRISGSTQKQDLYRLVQVVGTSKAADSYKVGKKNTDIMVEILNLDKTEVIPIDTVSNQEFTEEECKRLRQSIKCGLISRLTVGEILDKTMEIQVARINDWMESEVLRLSHLRDRASDLGRRKELRECVEKLQLLKTPEERRRRLEEIPRIHDDPKMDPSYESDENETENEDTRRDAFMRSKGISRRPRVPNSAGGDTSVKDSWSKTWEPNRNQFGINFSHANEVANEDSRSLGDKVTQESIDMSYASNSGSAECKARSELYSGAAVTSSPRLCSPVMETGVKINESEKMWHYKDPSGKEQGPFSIVQLRKWNNTGYFPSDLKIWRNTEKQDNSIPLAEALAGKFPKESPASSKISGNTLSKFSTEISGLSSPTPKATQSPRVFSSPSVGLSNGNNNNNNMTPSPKPNTISNSNVLQPSTVQAVQTTLNQNLQSDIQGWTGTTVQHQPQGLPNATYSVQPNANNASTNVGWAPVQTNPNIGWVNPQNVGWAPVQGAPNVNAGWVAAPAGTVGTMQVGPGSWVPTAPQVWGGGAQVPVNGWVPPGGNPVMTGNGWVSPGINTNQVGWGTWEGEQNNGSVVGVVGVVGGGQFSGSRDGGGSSGGQFSGGRDAGGLSGGRPYYRQSSFGSGRGGQYDGRREKICPFNTNQRCKKGANCEFLHV